MSICWTTLLSDYRTTMWMVCSQFNLLFSQHHRKQLLTYSKICIVQVYFSFPLQLRNTMARLSGQFLQ